MRVHLGNIPALSTIPFPWRCWCKVRESEMKESESVEQTWGCFGRRKASRPWGVERTNGHLIQDQSAKQPLDRQTEKWTDKRLFQVPNGSVHWRFKNIKEYSGGGLRSIVPVQTKGDSGQFFCCLFFHESKHLNKIEFYTVSHSYMSICVSEHPLTNQFLHCAWWLNIEVGRTSCLVVLQ